jgi:WG containing repeat
MPHGPTPFGFLAIIATILDCTSALMAQQATKTAPQDAFPVPIQREGRWGYADADGNIVIAPEFVQARKFSDGLAAVYIQTVPTSKVGFIDSHGVSTPATREMRKWGFIEGCGKIVIRPEFEAVGNFSEGLAAVSRQIPFSDTDTWGYINKQGEMVIKPQFSRASPLRVRSGPLPCEERAPLDGVY